MLRKFILATAAVMVASTSVLAADLPRAYTKAPVIPVTVFNWTGFYIGGYVGGAFANGDATSTEPRTAGGAFYNGLGLVNSYRPSDSFIGGGTVGYNWQAAGSKFVAGLEGEIGYLSLRRQVQDRNAITAGFGFPDSLDTTKIGDWYGIISGRAGFAANNWLFYGKAGVAFVNKSYSFNDSCIVGTCGPGILVLGTSRTQTTWAAGAGVEYALANNWSIKGEYLYIDTSETYTQTGTGAAGVAGQVYSNSHSDPGTHTFKFGVNYRLGGGPVVAKY